MGETKLEIWIGVIEINYGTDTVDSADETEDQTPNKRESAFTNVTTWASNYEEYSQKCRKMVEGYGWTLIGVENANPVPDDVEFSEEVEDMLERTRGNPSAIIYGTFSYVPGDVVVHELTTE
jgi:hypothetical protein